MLGQGASYSPNLTTLQELEDPNPAEASLAFLVQDPWQLPSSAVAHLARGQHPSSACPPRLSMDPVGLAGLFDISCNSFLGQPSRPS